MHKHNIIHAVYLTIDLCCHKIKTTTVYFLLNAHINLSDRSCMDCRMYRCGYLCWRLLCSSFMTGPLADESFRGSALPNVSYRLGPGYTSVREHWWVDATQTYGPSLSLSPAQGPVHVNSANQGLARHALL